MQLLIILALLLGLQDNNAPQERPGRGAVKVTQDLSPYYQFNEGSTWTYSSKYDVLDGDEVIASFDHPVISTKVVKFKDGNTFYEGQPTLIFFVKDGFLQLGMLTKEDEIKPMANIMKAGMNLGDKWKTYDAPQQTLMSEFEKFDVVETPAGKFNTFCIKTVQNETNYVRHWYASKVGLVKTERFDKIGNDAPLVRTTRVLEKYEIK